MQTQNETSGIGIQKKRTKLWYSASLAIVVLSPPGMIRELTLWSCSGFLISIPFTPNLLKAAQFKKSQHYFQQNSITEQDQENQNQKLKIKKNTCYVFVKRSLKSQNPDGHCDQAGKKKKTKGVATEIGENKKETWSIFTRCRGKKMESLKLRMETPAFRGLGRHKSETVIMGPRNLVLHRWFW